jgi:hypothetical protein
VTRENANTNPSDVISNTFYLDVTDYDPFGSINGQALCNDIRDLWITTLDPISDYPTTRVKMYNMEDPKPRPLRKTAVGTGSGGSASGPQEVALCLSFYGERNLPRQRGRLYIGPYFAGSAGGRPTATQMGKLITLGNGIANLGGINVKWVVYSPTAGSTKGVTNTWVDNAWDTQRSRGLAPTARQTANVQ